MSSQQRVSDSIRLSVTNIGGISETDLDFTSGVTVLKGRNATNRTSLLQAIMAACGSEEVSLKGDANSATVELTIDGTTYERTLTRKNGAVVGSGDELLSNPELAHLFAFLLESNEARQAVARGDALRELIMRPVDTTAIQAEIEQLEARKRQIDDLIEAIDDRKRKLPDLESERTRLTNEIEEKEGEIEEIEGEIDAAEGDLDERQQEQQHLDEKLEELRNLRSQLDDIRYDIETERESIESLKEEQHDVEAKLEDLPDGSEMDVQEIQNEIDSLRNDRQ